MAERPVGLDFTFIELAHHVAVEIESQEEFTVTTPPGTKFPDRKISETLLQFAQPLLDALGPNAAEAEIKQPLMLASIVWNAVVYDHVDANKQMLETLRASVGREPQLQGFIEFMIHRKRTLFGNDQRLIGEYALFRENGELRLRAEARDPNSKVQSSPTK